MLSSYDLIDYPSYTENAEDLVSMSGVSEADDKPSDEILSSSTTMPVCSLQRKYGSMSLTLCWNKLKQTDSKQIITNAEAGIPTLVGYFGSVSNTEERYGHAVVAIRWWNTVRFSII